MGTAYIQESSLTAIANAIRSKNGSPGTYTPSQMATAIEAMPPGQKCGVSISSFIGDVTDGVLNKPVGTTDLVLRGFTDMGDNALYYVFYGSPSIRSVNFADLEQLTGNRPLMDAFPYCTALTTASFPKLTTIGGTNALSNGFYGCTGLTTADFSKVTSITGDRACYSMFYNCTGLTTVDFSKVTSITGSYACYSMFYNCTGLTTADFSKVTSITGNEACDSMFRGCNNLESIDFSSLQIIGDPSAGRGVVHAHFYYAFYNCNKLTTLRFPLLESIYCNSGTASWSTFSNNNKIQSLYFPKLTYIGKTSEYTNDTGAKNIFYNCSSLAEIHFGAENQAAIEATTGYATKWGAPSGCQILFDL
jgi:hypothetical protein